MESVPSIPEFYANKTIFLTGATGFIGKVLIEKLLRSCPEIKAIYCLVRPKKGKAAEERLTALCDESVYDNLRELQPDFADKIHPIAGDIIEESLGISEEDQNFLINNTDIVIHSAATIRFNEPLRLALKMNVLAVRKMIHLCLKFKRLQVFVHVSTAYANCDKSHIEEMVYPPPVEPQRLIDAVEWMTDAMVEDITPHLIGKKPNTYTYTKQLAEYLLLEEGKDLPIAIVRPSIVTAAWREPTAGWIDNLNGPSGLYIAAGKGILRSILADGQTVADLIPVDLPVNMMVSVAWHTAVKKPEKPLIYQITSGTVNPCTWGQMEDLVMDFYKKIPLESCFRRPKCHITNSSWLHEYWMFVSHMIPAYIVDFGYKMAGKKPRMVQMYQKLHRAMGTLEFFTVRSWEWTHTNMDLLKNDMSAEDQKIFYFDPRALHWPTYMENYCLGAKKFILKEDESGIPAARAHLKKLRNIRYIFNTFLLVVFWRLMIARSSLARNSWFFVMGLVFKFVRFFRITSTITR